MDKVFSARKYATINPYRTSPDPSNEKDVRILNIPVAPLLFVLAGILLTIMVGGMLWNKRKARIAAEEQRVFEAYAPQRAWITRISSTGSSQYLRSQVEAPPIIPAGVDELSAFVDSKRAYEESKLRVADARKLVADAQAQSDPLEERRLLDEWSNEFSRSLPVEEGLQTRERIRQITKQQVVDLWERAKAGDRDATVELIDFTVRNSSRQDSFYRYMYANYMEPAGWVQVVCRDFASPTVDLLRTEQLDNGTLLLLAQTALRTQSIVKAKIVLAHWNFLPRAQSALPPELVDRLSAVVERHHAGIESNTRNEV